MTLTVITSTAHFERRAPDSKVGGSPTSPVFPQLSVRPLRMADPHSSNATVGGIELVRNQINHQLLHAPFSSPMSDADFQVNLLQSNPPTIYPVRWQGHQCFCVWRAGELVGLIDVGAGFDSDSLDLPDYSPIGFIRFLLLPSKQDQITEVTEALFVAVEQFWRQQSVGHIKAFHISTGYPQFQGGMGALPGGWADHIRVLTGQGFQFTDRFYALRRPLDQPLEEVIPLGQLSLLLRGKPNDRHYQLYRQVEQIGHARVVELTYTEGAHTIHIANLTNLYIDPEWRGQNIGKWLLRRLLNDALLQGYHQMLAHVPHQAFIMQNLLTQHGFQEQNYRGYTLEKSLTN